MNEVIASEASLDGHASADALQRFHRTVADLSGDPALKLFAGIVLQLSDAHSTFSRRPLQDRHRVVKRIRQLHRAIAKAIIERDAEGARRVVGRYLDGYQNWME